MLTKKGKPKSNKSIFTKKYDGFNIRVGHGVMKLPCFSGYFLDIHHISGHI